MVLIVCGSSTLVFFDRKECVWNERFSHSKSNGMKLSRLKGKSNRRCLQINEYRYYKFLYMFTPKRKGIISSCQLVPDPKRCRLSHKLRFANKRKVDIEKLTSLT